MQYVGRLKLPVEKDTKIVVLSDLHLPFTDPAALQLAVKICEYVAPDIVILNGDIVDFHGISLFFRLPDRRAGFRREIEVDRELLHQILQVLPQRPTYWIEGNHEHRMEVHLMTRSPELYGLDVLQLPSLLCVEDKVHYLRRATVPASRVERVSPEIGVGHLTIAHGDMWRSGANTILIARTLFLRLQVQALIGHWHRNDVWEQTGYDGKVKGFWVSGCLCYPRPEYDAGRHWGQGMAVVDVYPDGMFRVDLVRFIPEDRELTALVSGKRFSARLRRVLSSNLEDIWTQGRQPKLL
jgi:metallophosphoesterase superfamily enzyme